MKRLLAALALVCALAGAAVLIGADNGLSTQDVRVNGVPLTVVRSGTPRAGVVVAHGFGGSARLMTGFADTLARHGFAVALVDFAGHGRNTGRWHDTAALSADLDVAVAHLRKLPGLDGKQTVLVGHSMGAAAVTSYAASHPEIAATVAISLGVKPDVVPHKLLLIVGGLEFRDFKEAAAAAAQGADPGDRRVVVVPGVEHVSVLFTPRPMRRCCAGSAPIPGRRPSRRAVCWAGHCC